MNETVTHGATQATRVMITVPCGARGQRGTIREVKTSVVTGQPLLLVQLDGETTLRSYLDDHVVRI